MTRDTLLNILDVSPFDTITIGFKKTMVVYVLFIPCNLRFEKIKK